MWCHSLRQLLQLTGEETETQRGEGERNRNHSYKDFEHRSEHDSP